MDAYHISQSVYYFGLWMFFLGGVEEGKRTHQGKYCRVVFAGDE